MKPLKVLTLGFEPKIVKIHRIARNMAKNFCTEAGFFQQSVVFGCFKVPPECRIPSVGFLSECVCEFVPVRNC